MLRNSSIGHFPRTTAAAITAGTTQTQVGATAITKGINKVTNGNANDGVALPRADQPCHVDQVIEIQVGANNLNVYPYYTSASTNDDGTAYGGTIDGGSANASVSQGANTTYKYCCTAKNTWISVKMS